MQYTSIETSLYLLFSLASECAPRNSPVFKLKIRTHIAMQIAQHSPFLVRERMLQDVEPTPCNARLEVAFNAAYCMLPLCASADVLLRAKWKRTLPGSTRCEPHAARTQRRLLYLSPGKSTIWALHSRSASLLYDARVRGICLGETVNVI